MTAAGAPAHAAVDAPRASVEYLLALADDRLVLGHRLSEWCGHAPILEEDIALGNVALDLIGQAQGLLAIAGAREGAGRDADALAFFRDADAFRSAPLVEVPNGDFAATIVRQLFFDALDVPLTERLTASADAELAGVMAKANKEARYHLRHSADWTVRLGDGTDESRRRAQAAVDALWPYALGQFAGGAAAGGAEVDVVSLRGAWEETVAAVLGEATLRVPDYTRLEANAAVSRGAHTPHLAPMLAEMQSVARAHPGAAW